MSAIVLQNIIFPSDEINTIDEMYFRTNKRIKLIEDNLYLKENTTIKFDTFYNAVSIGVWKKNTVVNDLSLRISGKGSIVIKFNLHKIGQHTQTLDEIELDLSESNTDIPVKKWNELNDGLLYIELLSLNNVQINSCQFITNTPKTSDTKLGIVITHFNRKKYVLPAINRMEKYLLSTEEYKDSISLIVVDNSQNIEKSEIGEKTIVIPNENYGGSGGFTRGLLYLKDKQEFTHCLFMDDDASCEIESIKRAYLLAAFSNNPEISISGALLRDLEPWNLQDKGSNFDGYPYCSKAGLDMRHVKDLLKAEIVETRYDFGGWWFLLFKIDQLKHFSFPFFVKCDDILFGMMNKFPIITMNGIACLSDDFGYKEGPFQRYLDTRSRFVLNLVTGNHSLLQNITLLARFTLMPLLSYNYGSAKAANLAIKHAMSGPDFWIKNIDTTEIRKELSLYSKIEKMDYIDRSKLNITYSKNKRSKIKKLLRLATLNGFLLPKFLLKDKILYQNKGFRGNLSQIFGYKQVLYYYEPFNQGYTIEHNKKKFYYELFSFIKNIILYTKNYKKLKNEYNEKLSYLTSEELWRKIYKL